MKFEKRIVTPDQLLLDPNNYRFHDLKLYKRVAQRARYKEPGVQFKALSLLKETASFNLNSLMDSIKTNGYVAIEQIVVVEYTAGDKPLYLIIEGNRRGAAIKTLLDDSVAGSIDLSDSVLESLTQVPVVMLSGTDDETASYQKTLMAIRHVAGIQEWGPYQQAKLVVELFEEEGATLGSVAQQIGISSREVARRYRASKALFQMEADEEFQDHADPRLYVFFHEAVSAPKVRKWLSFNDETYKAEDEGARRLFFELLSPREIEGETLPPKLTSANTQVRQLKDIVDKEYPLEVLSDPHKSFDEAVKAGQDEQVHHEDGVVERSLAAAINALNRPGLDYMDANDRAKELWTELKETYAKVSKLMGGE